MSKCYLCGTHTQLYINGVPICLECEAENRQQKKPVQADAGKKADAQKTETS
jgi:hypothetical protein